jgi:hypothetical protein
MTSSVEEEEDCEACIMIYKHIETLRNLGAIIDLVGYRGPHPLKCRNGHLITEDELYRRSIV